MATRGMTLKQAARARFLDACNRLRELRAARDFGPEFVRLSRLAHATKGDVPKRLWSLANR